MATAPDVGQGGDRVAGRNHLGDGGRRACRRLDHPVCVDSDPADRSVARGRGTAGFGGGHGSFVDSAYDCSGSVSYALAAGGLLSAPVTSGELERWGAPGPGRYITVFANAGHTYMYVDGVRYDTSGRSGIYASRWQVAARDNGGFVARHWPGL